MVIGGIEDTPEKRLFLIIVPDRSKNTLTEVVRSHVLPGSLIFTDFWKGYNDLQKYYNRETLNHSENCMDHTTGACTNRIEGTWNGLKHFIPARNRTTKVRLHLLIFIWRRVNRNRLWEAFLEGIRN